MRILKPIFTVLVLGAIVFVFYQWLIFPLFSAKAKLIHMMDPDTLLVMENGKLIKVQLIGVDAPELTGPQKNRQCFDKDAQKAAAQYFKDKREISLEKDSAAGEKDVYNRELRYVKIADGSLLNEFLLHEGLAKTYTPGLKDLKYRDALIKAENDAKTTRVGIWNVEGCKGMF